MVPSLCRVTMPRSLRGSGIALRAFNQDLMRSASMKLVGLTISVMRCDWRKNTNGRFFFLRMMAASILAGAEGALLR